MFTSGGIDNYYKHPTGDTALLVQDALGWSKGRSLVHGQSGRLTRGLSEMNIRWFVTALLNKFNEDLIWE